MRSLASKTHAARLLLRSETDSRPARQGRARYSGKARHVPAASGTWSLGYEASNCKVCAYNNRGREGAWQARGVSADSAGESIASSCHVASWRGYEACVRGRQHAAHRGSWYSPATVRR
jgi:hypothetical protein